MPHRLGRDTPARLRERLREARQTIDIVRKNGVEAVALDDGDGKAQETGDRRADLPFTEADGSTVVLEIGVDSTDRQEAAARLARANAELEDRVAARTAELTAANKELEAFTYSVSHDLRAPLRAIQGFSRILLEEHEAQLGAEAARYLRLIGSNAGQMGHLIDDLLDFSRLGRHAMELVPLDMRDLVEDAFGRLAAEREGRSVELTVGDLPGCVGDRSLFRHLMTNLLSNALKFTRPRRLARIDVGSSVELARGTERVYFVRDNGVGFDMRYADKLFGVFQRMHPADQFEGTGVGLATVHRIVTRHGGRVWAEGAVDGGATFYFTVPGAQHEQPAD